MAKTATAVSTSGAVLSDYLRKVLLIARRWDARRGSISSPAPRRGWHQLFVDAADRGFAPRGQILIED